MTNYIRLFTFMCLLYKALGEGCCEQKTVGDDTYTYVGTTDLNSKYECQTDCLYSKDGEENPERLYCFKSGPLFVNGYLPVECNDPAVTKDPPVTNDPPECPMDWISFDTTSHGKKCVKLFKDERKSPTDAAKKCRESNGHLLSIHSDAETQFIKDTFYNQTLYSVWIGLVDPDQNGVWEWDDGSSMDYANWSPGRPDDKSRWKYGLLLGSTSSGNTGGNYTWYDRNGNLNRPFICQIITTSPTATTKTSTTPTTVSVSCNAAVADTGCQVCLEDPTDVCKVNDPLKPCTDCITTNECSGAYDACGIDGTETPEPPNVSGCPYGWSRIQDKCYKLFDTFQTWERASIECSKIPDASLASIENADQQQFAFGLSRGEWVWLGSSGRRGSWFWQSSGTGFWSDNKTLGQYINFAPGQPREANGCLAMDNSTGEWWDFTCTDSVAHYLCEVAAIIPVPGCPYGWSKNQETCYKIFSTRRTWEEASTACSTVPGASLASIDNEAEQEFAFNLRLPKIGRPTAIWLGGSDIVTPGTWVWENSDTVFMVDNTAVPGIYNNFAGGQPSGAGDSCVGMSSYNGGWWDYTCDSRVYPYLCELPAPESVPSCPSGWSQIQEKCFKKFSDIITWEDASAECSKIPGGSLVTIDNDDQQWFAYRVSGGVTWLGGTDKVTEGTWVWQSSGEVFMVDDTPIPGVYNNFDGNVGTPNSDTYDCLTMHSTNGGWYPGTCDIARATFLCEIAASVSGK